jgi:iron complex outermembrane receptor protein
MKRVTVFLALLLLCSQAAGALELTGRVVDPEGQPLIGVSVVTDITGVGAVTNNEGVFTLLYDDGVTRITLSSIGYQSRQFNLIDLPDTVVLDPMYYPLGKVVVTADRAEAGITPIAFENLSADEIERDYTVGEFPLLLENTPNLHVFTDGGTPLGYSYMRIRGFDLQRIATYINGVPLNDPEDHYTYFTDLPDFAANISDIQVQRGVGNSLYGDASFGGTINVVTSTISEARQTVLSTGYGFYTADDKVASDIYKQSIEYSSGLIGGQWAFTGRFSRQKTGGYRHNSWYQGWAYYLSAARLDPNMITELHVYGGPIRMHLSYWGASRDAIEQDHRYNPLTYSNETDNFNQPHYQLHNRYRLNDRAVLSNTVYYVRGKGFFEQFKDQRKYSDYSISSDLIAIDTTTGNPFTRGDLVRQKWVYKNQVGWNGRLDIEHDRGSHGFGGSYYYFESDHWGQVVWAQHIAGSLDPRHRYYQYFGEKHVASAFVSEFYRLTDKLSTQLTAQLRYAAYELEQVKQGPFAGHRFDLDWLFFSPRIGLNYAFDQHTTAFINLAVASRVPNDENIYDADDPDKFPQLEIVTNHGDTLYEFGDPTIENERVYEITLGAQHHQKRYQVGVDVYWSRFDNENVFEGGMDQLDRQITINIDEAVIAGLELSGSVNPLDELTVGANVAFNYNRITRYDTTLFYTVDSGAVTLSESIKVDYKDKKKPLFPDLLAGVVADYKKDWYRITYRGKILGRQYMELLNIEELSIDPYFVSSLSAEVSVRDFLDIGRLIIMGRVDNLFNSKYEVSGYGGNYAYRLPGQAAVVDGWAEYFVGPERSFYTQVALQLF